MSSPSAHSLESYPLKTFCSLQANEPPLSLKRSAEELFKKIDRILTRGVVCPHIIDQLLLFRTEIEQVSREGPSCSERQALLSTLINRVGTAINRILTLPNEEASSRDLINLYYLTQFSRTVLPNTLFAENLLQRRRVRGGNFTPESIAQQLPYCVSEKRFLDDFRSLTALDQCSAPEIVRRRAKVLKKDAQLRERRLAFLDGRNAADYPPYLDQILEGGFLCLYHYLLDIVEYGEDKCRKEIRAFDAAEINQIVLETRHAIVRYVRQLVHEAHGDVVFLVGNTGSGKSTTAALLQRELLERIGDRYEVPGQNRIGHDSTVSCTFLPNVHVSEHCTYVDFPGFNDTRGELINLGIELAFKALVNEYSPKVVIVESIKAIETSRGTHVADLGKQLKRMLGKRTPCPVFLTQYLQMAESARLSNALDRKKKLEIKIARLERKISQREEKIEELRQRIRPGDGYITGNRQVETQMQEKRERNREDRNELQTKERELGEWQEQVIQERGNLTRKSQRVLDLLDTASENHCLAELHDLEDPLVLSNCMEVLRGTRPVGNARQKLSDCYRTPLLERFKQAFTDGGIPSPPVLGIDELRRQIMKTSLTAVLTEGHSPEIGAFFHLPEMDPGCVEELDCHIVKGFADALIRLVAVGSLDKGSEEDPIKDFIEKQIAALIKKPEEKSSRLWPQSPLLGILRKSPQKSCPTPSEEQELLRLQEKWRKLKERVLENSAIRARDWDELEQHYRQCLENTLDRIDEVGKRHLKDWDQWAARFFGFEGVIGLPKQCYASRASRSANRLTLGEIDKAIDSLNCSFDEIRELRKIIECKRQIEEQWQQCTGVVGGRVEFLSRVQAAINHTRRIYDKDAREGETWNCRLGEIDIRLRNSLPGFCPMLREVRSEHAWLLRLMQLEFCGQKGLSNRFICHLSEQALAGGHTQKSLRGVIKELETMSGTRNWIMAVRSLRQEMLAARLGEELAALSRWTEKVEENVLAKRIALSKRAEEAIKLPEKVMLYDLRDDVSLVIFGGLLTFLGVVGAKVFRAVLAPEKPEESWEPEPTFRGFLICVVFILIMASLVFGPLMFLWSSLRTPLSAIGLMSARRRRAKQARRLREAMQAAQAARAEEKRRWERQIKVVELVARSQRLALQEKAALTSEAVLELKALLAPELVEELRMRPAVGRVEGAPELILPELTATLALSLKKIEGNPQQTGPSWATAKLAEGMAAEQKGMSAQAEEITKKLTAGQAEARERIEELEGLEEIRERLQRGEEAVEIILALSDVGKIIAKAEQLLGLEQLPARDLLDRVRGINGALARSAGLSLEISLHRMLLLDFLTKNRPGIDESE